MIFPWPDSMPVRVLAGILVAGVLANFLFYRFDEQDVAEAGSGWQPPQRQDTAARLLERALLGDFIGVVTGGDDGADVALGRNATESARRLVYAGVTYRLTGLVVSGARSAATLVSDASEPLRVLVGGQLPGGETIKAITLNEIVIINAEGREESVKIYE